MVSNEANPHLMGRGAENAASAKALLGSELGAVILEPLASGYSHGLSYVLWPWQSPLSDRRVLRYVQRMALRPRVFRWLREAAAHTRAELAGEDARNLFEIPLASMSGDDRFPQEMRMTAERGLERLRIDAWHPMAGLHHGDFVLENLLLARRAEGAATSPHGFYVIDWGGAVMQGYPFLDTFTLTRTARASDRALRREAGIFCRAFACEPPDILCYLLAGIAARGMDLEFFPEERFLRGATRAFAYAERVLRGMRP